MVLYPIVSKVRRLLADGSNPVIVWLLWTITSTASSCSLSFKKRESSDGLVARIVVQLLRFQR